MTRCRKGHALKLTKRELDEAPRVTPQWGERKGDKMTIRGRISAWLDSRSDNYGSNVPTQLDKIVAATVREAFDNQFAPEVEAALGGKL